MHDLNSLLCGLKMGLWHDEQLEPRVVLVLALDRFTHIVDPLHGVLPFGIVLEQMGVNSSVQRASLDCGKSYDQPRSWIPLVTICTKVASQVERSDEFKCFLSLSVAHLFDLLLPPYSSPCCPR